MERRSVSKGGQPHPATGIMSEALILLPGPVKVHPGVRDAFMRPPVSHRDDRFIQDFNRVRRQLRSLVNSSKVEVLLGSGTLANDAVAGQLSLLGNPGLILCNGEFGDRLVEHAKRFGLSFDVLSADWGRSLRHDQVRRLLRENRRIRWVWAVHCETSTGVLNDVDELKVISREHDVHLCLDCISSIGAVPVDAEGVYLATGVSGKGLASYPGLSMVFHHHDIRPSATLPRYLDLGNYAGNGGVPFTFSSNLVYALGQSLARFAFPGGNGVSGATAIFEEKAALARWLRSRLEDLGFSILAPEAIASPAVITLALPTAVNSVGMGEDLERHGFFLSYRSQYLRRRNLIQICLMGDHTRKELTPLLLQLKRVI